MDATRLRRLEGVVRRYAWGSRTFIPELRRRDPDGEPQAELWLGAHPSAPARVPPSGLPNPKPSASPTIDTTVTGAAGPGPIGDADEPPHATANTHTPERTDARIAPSSCV